MEEMEDGREGERMSSWARQSPGEEKLNRGRAGNISLSHLNTRLSHSDKERQHSPD